MNQLKDALEARNLTVSDEEIQAYLEDLGFSESELDPLLVEQLVEDLARNAKPQSSKLAKANGNKPAKRRGGAIEPPPPSQSKEEPLTSAVTEHARELQQYVKQADDAIALMNNAAVEYLGDRLKRHSQDFDQRVSAKVEEVNASRPRLNLDDVEKAVLEAMPAGFAVYWEQAKAG